MVTIYLAYLLQQFNCDFVREASIAKVGASEFRSIEFVKIKKRGSLNCTCYVV